MIKSRWLTVSGQRFSVLAIRWFTGLVIWRLDRGAFRLEVGQRRLPPVLVNEFRVLVISA